MVIRKCVKCKKKYEVYPDNFLEYHFMCKSCRKKIKKQGGINAF